MKKITILIIILAIPFLIFKFWVAIIVDVIIIIIMYAIRKAIKNAILYEN